MIHMIVLMYSIVEILTDAPKQKNKDLCLENETLSSEYEAYQVKKGIQDFHDNYVFYKN